MRPSAHLQHILRPPYLSRLKTVTSMWSGWKACAIQTGDWKHVYDNEAQEGGVILSLQVGSLCRRAAPHTAYPPRTIMDERRSNA